MDQWQSDIHIVLTGTIVPNASFTVINDPSRRRQEYLDAIRYYSQFAPVHFLENSSHELSSDADFISSARVTIRQFPVSLFARKGKGYQEFEMLDSWVSSNKNPPRRWVKITGRYIVRNISDILMDCRRAESYAFIIDLCGRSKIARTHLFYAETDAYRNYLLDSYRECNDESGDWIERVLFNKIRGWDERRTRTFSLEPNVTAVSGSTGASYDSSISKYKINSIMRAANNLFDKQCLWYAK